MTLLISKRVLSRATQRSMLARWENTCCRTQIFGAYANVSRKHTRMQKVFGLRMVLLSSIFRILVVSIITHSYGHTLCWTQKVFDFHLS